MSLICAIFGHKSLEHEHGGGEYVRLGNYAALDGLGVTHQSLMGRCPRCREEYRVAIIHLYDGEVCK